MARSAKTRFLVEAIGHSPSIYAWNAFEEMIEGAARSVLEGIEKPIDAVRRRNRDAQRKFRERQKKLKNSESENCTVRQKNGRLNFSDAEKVKVTTR